MATRQIPQNLEAEMAVLGSAFLAVPAKDKICEELNGDMFYLDKHQKIFAAIKELYEEGIPLDITTLKEKLSKRKTLEASGGMEYLSEIIDSVATASNIEYYINIIKDKYLLRSIINVSTDIITDVYESKEAVNEIVDKADKEFSNVIKNRRTGEFVKISEVLRKTQDNLERLAKNKSDVTGLATGFYSLDKVTSGLQPHDLIILAGRPSMGKTALGLNLATNVALNNDKAVAIFSLEMGAEQLVTRMIGAVGGIDMNKLRTGRLEHNDWKRVNEAISELADAKLYIEDASGMTVSEIRAKCRRLANSEDGLSLVIIDYLQLIAGSARYAGQRQQEVSEISRALKTLAMELHIPIIALAQLSRSPELRENKRPNLSDLRESGSIEQDADIVAFLYRDDYYNKTQETSPNSVTELIIGKHRNGATGTIKLLFERNMSNFRNYMETDTPEGE
ncbi:MAG TPA: replicative DNA helicase [Bacilli bacterium]|nr:replicative DNA helicase [Bacilli bacterium]